MEYLICLSFLILISSVLHTICFGVPDPNKKEPQQILGIVNSFLILLKAFVDEQKALDTAMLNCNRVNSNEINAGGQFNIKQFLCYEEKCCYQILCPGFPTRFINIDIFHGGAIEISFFMVFQMVKLPPIKIRREKDAPDSCSYYLCKSHGWQPYDNLSMFPNYDYFFGLASRLKEIF